MARKPPRNNNHRAYLRCIGETTGRVIKEVEPLLSASIVINRHHKRIRTMKNLHEAIPDLSEVIIDTTEQRVNWPRKKRARKKHHSGKRKDFTLKEQIIATKEKIILHVSDPVPGRTHDHKLFHQSGVPQSFDCSAREVEQGQTGAHPVGENPQHQESEETHLDRKHDCFAEEI